MVVVAGGEDEEGVCSKRTLSNPTAIKCGEEGRSCSVRDGGH